MKKYWNSGDLFKTKIKEIMSKSFFDLLAKALHFPEKEENDLNKENFGYDPRNKITRKE